MCSISQFRVATRGSQMQERGERSLYQRHQLCSSAASVLDFLGCVYTGLVVSDDVWVRDRTFTSWSARRVTHSRGITGLFGVRAVQTNEWDGIPLRRRRKEYFLDKVLSTEARAARKGVGGGSKLRRRLSTQQRARFSCTR